MAAPIEVLLTDVARLVLAYLYDEKMDELANQFCQQNPLLEQERVELEASGRAVNYCVTTLPVLVQNLCEDHHRLQLLLEKYDQGYRFVQDPSMTLIDKIELLLVERIDKMFSVGSRMGSPSSSRDVECTEPYANQEVVHHPRSTNSAASDQLQQGMSVPVDENDICWLLPNRNESQSCSTTNTPVAGELEAISMMELVQVDGCSIEEEALVEPGQRYCYEVPEVWLTPDENELEPALTVEVSAEEPATALAKCGDDPEPTEYASTVDLGSLDANKTPMPTVEELHVKPQPMNERLSDNQDRQNTEVSETGEANEQQQQQKLQRCQEDVSVTKHTPPDKRVVIDLGLANIISVVAANTSPTLITSHRPTTVQSATTSRPAMAVRPIMVVQPSSLPLTSSSMQQMVSPTTKALVEKRTHVRRLVFDIPPMMPLKRMTLGTTAVFKGEELGIPADVCDGATETVATTTDTITMAPPNADTPKPKIVRRTAEQRAQDAAEWKRIRSVNISNFDMHLRTVIAEQEKRRQEVESKRLLALRLERKRDARAKQRALAAAGSNNRRKAATTKLKGTAGVTRKGQCSPPANAPILATPNTTQKQAAMIEAALASPIIMACAKLPPTDSNLPRQTFHQCLMVEASISTNDSANTSGWLPTVPPPCPVPQTPKPSRPQVITTMTPMLHLSNEDSDSPYKIDPVTDIPQTPRFRIPIQPPCSPPQELVATVEQHRRNLLGELDDPLQATLLPNPPRPKTPGSSENSNSTTSKIFETATSKTAPTEAEQTDSKHHHYRADQMNLPDDSSNKQTIISSPPSSPAQFRKLSAVPTVPEPAHPPMSPMENEREHNRLINSALRRKRKAEEAMRKATAKAADDGRIDHSTPMGFGSPKMYHVLLVGRAAASGGPVGARKRPKRYRRYKLEEDDPVMEVFNGESRFTIARSELAVHYEQRPAHEETLLSVSGASYAHDSVGSDSDSSSSSSSSSSSNSNSSKNTSNSNSSSSSNTSSSSSSSGYNNNSSNSYSRPAVVIEAEDAG
ncbi:uncharacterized protein LOC118461301 [Anopheles albimanus]|uniref:LisH domain-containing protein n=1 Tax=Anopheles albimanus TaxID=7167 RepID=A0A8W7JQM0_ANOAL|nr:uncharacterized protein LOC118461301 [Anopheles albimanus]